MQNKSVSSNEKVMNRMIQVFSVYELACLQG